MSIVIKGMDMPTSCSRCPCSNDESRFCRAAEEYVPMLGKPAFCPLVDVPDTNVEDMISRRSAIDALIEWYGCKPNDIESFEKIIEALPSAQPVQDEWCTGCKEYDSEKHCCPRFNRVIRNALKDAQPEIIRCKDCKYYRECEIFGRKITLCKRREYDALNTEPDDFCSRAERRTNGET